VNGKQKRFFSALVPGYRGVDAIFGAALAVVPLGRTWQKGQQHDSMPRMDMRANGDMNMSGMGQAWRPMAATCI